MADQEQAPVGRHTLKLGQRLARAESAGQRRMDQQAFALSVLPPLGGQLGGLAGPDLGAEQHGIEACVQPRQRGARGASLRFATCGQPALGIRARPVRLRLGVT